MNQLFIEKDQATPQIDFNFSEGKIKIIGNAFDQRIHTKFDELLDWVKRYEITPNQATRVDIEIDKISSTCLKSLYNMLCVLVNLHKEGKTNLTIFWYQSFEEEKSQTVEWISEALSMEIVQISYLES